MAIKKWTEMTPLEIEALDKDKTIVLVPLGTMGSPVDTKAVGTELLALEGEVQELVELVNGDVDGPMGELEATALPPIWFGSEPGPSLAGTVTAPEDTYKDVIKGLALSLKAQGVKSVVFVVRDHDLEEVAAETATELNEGADPLWVKVYNPPYNIGDAAADNFGRSVCIFITSIFSPEPDPRCLQQ